MPDLVGRNRPHVDTFIYKGLAFEQLVDPGNVLHVGVVAHGCAVDDEGGAERRGGIIVVRNADLAQADRIGFRQLRRRRGTARKQRQQVGETRRLDVLHRLAVDRRRTGAALRFGGRNDDVADGEGERTQPHLIVRRSFTGGFDRHMPGLISDICDARIVQAGRKREGAFSGKVGRRGMYLAAAASFQLDCGVCQRFRQGVRNLELDLDARSGLAVCRRRQQCHTEKICQTTQESHHNFHSQSETKVGTTHKRSNRQF